MNVPVESFHTIELFQDFINKHKDNKIVFIISTTSKIEALKEFSSNGTKDISKDEDGKNLCCDGRLGIMRNSYFESI